jgi:hypothetical protein
LPDFWKEGGRYELTLTPGQPVKLVPELQRSLGTPKDSVSGVLQLDSLRADSLWGTFSIALTDIGLLVPTIGPQPPSFRGRVDGKAFSLMLNSQVTDAGVWMEGETISEGTGTWRAANRSVQGTLRIRRID